MARSSRETQKQYIWGDAKYLSGPVSATVYQLPRDKQVYIFGDEHSSRAGQCSQPEPDAESILAVLKRLCDERSRDVDVYLESLHVPYQNRARSPLGDAKTAYIPETHHHLNGKKCHAARFHWTDPRHVRSWSVVRSRAGDFLKNINTAARLRRFTDAFLTSTAFKQDVAKLWPSFPSPDGTTARFVTAKEFHRLPRAPQQFVLAHIDDFFRRRELLSSEKYYRKFVATCALKQWKKHRDLYLDYVLEELGVLLMDVYLLCRFAKFVKRQSAGGISVIFCGDAHCDNYVRFFNAIPTFRPVFHHKAAKRSPRCIDLGRNMLPNITYWTDPNENVLKRVYGT